MMERAEVSQPAFFVKVWINGFFNRTVMDLGLSGTVCLITGANGGIGVATVKAFLEQGAIVVAQYRSSDAELQQLKSNGNWSNEQLILLQADLTNENQVVEMFEKMPPTAVLVVNHAVYVSEDVPLQNMSLDQFSNTITSNLTSSFLVIREYLKQLRSFLADDPIERSRKVSCVLIGSTAAKFGEANHADYACSKSAMQYGLTLSLKNEIVKIAPYGRVNTVAPGWTLTPMAVESLKKEGVIETALATTPLRKVAKPVEVANQILNMASPVLSSHVSGVTVLVEGGMEGRLLNTAESLKGVIQR